MERWNVMLVLWILLPLRVWIMFYSCRVVNAPQFFKSLSCCLAKTLYSIHILSVFCTIDLENICDSYFGSVACVCNIKNPIQAAYRILSQQRKRGRLELGRIPPKWVVIVMRVVCLLFVNNWSCINSSWQFHGFWRCWELVTSPQYTHVFTGGPNQW